MTPQFKSRICTPRGPMKFDKGLSVAASLRCSSSVAAEDCPELELQAELQFDSVEYCVG